MSTSAVNRYLLTVDSDTTITDLAALTAANAAGSTPTQAEFNKVVADLTALHATLSSIADVLSA